MHLYIQGVSKVTDAFIKLNKYKRKAIEMIYLLHSSWKTSKFLSLQNFKLSYKVRQQMTPPVIYERSR